MCFATDQQCISARRVPCGPEKGGGLVDGAPGPREATLLGYRWRASFTSIDRFPQLHESEIGELLGDGLQS
jgi:hypothetical protein